MGYIHVLKGKIRHIGFGFTHYYFSSLGQTFFISVFVEQISQSLGMKNQGFSLVYAAATISSALVLPFIGVYIDRMKLRHFSMLNGLAMAFFAFVISLSTHRIVLFIGIMGIRLTGQALMPLIGAASMARHFEKDRGKALSLASFGLSISETIMPVIGIILIELAGWQHAWQLLSLAALLIFIPIAGFIVPGNDPFHTPPSKLTNEPDPKRTLDKTRGQILRERRFYVLVLAAIFTPFFITGMFIHHNLLAGFKGWTMEWIATCFIGYGVCKSFTSLFAGPIVDKLTARKVFPFYMLPMFIGSLVLIFGGNSPGVALVYLCLTGITTSLMSISATAMWAEIFGYTHIGAIKSTVTTFVVFASAIGPLVIGLFLEHQEWWNLGIAICAVAMCALSVSSWLVLRENDTQASRS